MEKTSLKKTVAAVLALAMLLSLGGMLVSCNPRDNGGNDVVDDLSVPVYNTTGQSQKAAIILPGILGSNLVDRESEKAVWSIGSFLTNIAMNKDIVSEENGFNSDLFYGYLSSFLRRNASGAFSRSKVGAANMNDVNLEYGLLSAYEGLYDLVKATIGQSTSYNYQVKVFQYDWRKSCTDSAADLAEFIRQNKYEDVILIGHSMGGLVIDYYLAESAANRDNTKAVITLGTPHLGAVDSPAVLLGKTMPTAGEFISTDMLQSMLDELSQSLPQGYDSLMDFAEDMAGMLADMARTLPSAYELFPSLALTQSDLYSASSPLYVVNGSLSDYAALNTYMSSAPWADENAYVKGVIDNLFEKQQSLYINNVFVSELVDSHYFAGSGVSTTKSLSMNLSADGDFVYNSYSSTPEGDMLVLLQSAVAGKRLDSDNVYVFEQTNHLDIATVYNLETSEEVGGSINYTLNAVGVKLKEVLTAVLA